MGIISAIYRYGSTSGDTQNIFSVPSASYDYGQFVDDMEKIFRNTGSIFTNSGVTINVSMDGMRNEEFGFNFNKLVTPHGVVQLVYAPVLRNEYANHMVIVEPDNLSIKEFRPFRYSANVKTEDDYDGVKDAWLYDLQIQELLMVRLPMPLPSPLLQQQTV